MRTNRIFIMDKDYERIGCWGTKVSNAISSFSDKTITYIYPYEYYQYKDEVVQNNTEVMRWEINQLRDCDIVIVDLSTIRDEIDTHVELGVINAINSMGNKYIYVVGIGKSNTKNPWILQSVFHSEDTIKDMAKYISHYLLI